jgi:hypothetical protein
MIRKGNVIMRRVMIETIALRSMCLNMTRDSFSPFARAVRM